ncbi:thymidylate kinase-like isoform X3 [Quercus robur]|uniref:thymidylate kinase-like isoform X3 n=1 Tax=Quercus robur TaxID=38942 RepID=UPI002162B551|nr:thymidylate kinase-like isoform X3 [Quercus robur]
MIHSYHSYSPGLNFGVQAFGKSLKSQLNFPHKCPIGQIQMANTHNSIVSGCNSESRGALVVLEGLDRSGKTSQSSRLLTYLEGLGHSVELWRFPDRSTNVGQMISSYLSNKSQLDDHTIHLLFSANRWEKRSLMETKLKTGTTLIVDRYSYSGVAFSSAKGLGDEWCKAPEIGLLAPDLVLYLDIQPEKAAERGGYGDEKYEQLEFQRKVAQCYQVLHDASWKIVDACQPIEDIEKQLQELVLECVMACQKGKPLANLWSVEGFEQHTILHSSHRNSILMLPSEIIAPLGSSLQKLRR